MNRPRNKELKCRRKMPTLPKSMPIADFDDHAAGMLVKGIVSVFAGEDERIKPGLDRCRGRQSCPDPDIGVDLACLT